MSNATFSVPEIVCEGCAESIKRALGTLGGVSGVEVDIPNKSVRVEFEEPRTSPAAIRERIEAAGFDVA